MAQHIGIVACSAPGAALCYETICVEGSQLMGRHHNPEVSLHTLDFAEHVQCMERDDWDGVADLLLRSVRKVAAAGADFAICPDNTAHVAMAKVAPHSPIPWLHIVDAVADAAKSQGFRRLGLLGTRALVESSVYPERLKLAGLEWRLPDPDDRGVVDRIIFDELVFSRVTSDARSQFARIIEALKVNEDCDAVVLGCTEIPLAVAPGDSVLPTLDSTRLLARAALKRAAE